MEDQFGDGWDVAKLVVTRPDGSKDFFQNTCETKNPHQVRYAELRNELAAWVAATPACMQRAGMEAQTREFLSRELAHELGIVEPKTGDFHSARSAGREAAAAVGEGDDAVADAAEIAISVGVIAGASSSLHFTMPSTHERLSRPTLRPHSPPPPVETSPSRGGRGGFRGGVQAGDEATSQQGSQERIAGQAGLIPALQTAYDAGAHMLVSVSGLCHRVRADI